MMISNLKKLRENTGMGVCEFAKRIGVRQPSYSLLEKQGHYKALEKAYKIADALGVGIYDIWPRDESTTRVEQLEAELKHIKQTLKDLIGE